jgi:class 3 adenylate cyclase
VIRCGNCAEVNPERARFCLACGAPLAPSTTDRRLVTALFCDLVGSTHLGERLDPEVLRRVLDRYHASMREAIERHGGTVEKFIGDAVVGVFGIPATHEDDALRAARAALEMRDALPALRAELELDLDVRIGLQSGEAVADLTTAIQGRVAADVFNTSARLQSAAAPGSILVGEETAKLLREGDTPLDYPNQIETRRIQESQAIATAKRPYMIVASNGMLTGGRVVGHLRNLIDDPLAVLLFVGYQGEGTLGAHLQAGAKEVRIDGQQRQVRCQIRSISGFSAHADEGELLDWLKNFATGKARGSPGFPKVVFLVHGDPEAQIAIEPKVRALGFETKIPHWREVVQLD